MVVGYRVIMTQTKRVFLPSTGSLVPFNATVSTDHPLWPLVQHYAQLRELAQSAETICERMAPTPMRMMDHHPAEDLTGQDAEYYQNNYRRAQHYGHAASMAYQALNRVIDNLGGI